MIHTDIRLRSLLVTVGLVIVITATVSYWPSMVVKQAPDDGVEEVTANNGFEQQFDEAVNYLRHRQFHKAIEGFRKVLALSPSVPEAYLNLGFAHYELQHYRLAVDSFQVAIDLRPSQTNAYWGLAVSLEALCDFPAALGAMKTYVHLSKEDNQYMKKARAAIWEWESKKNNSSAGSGEHTDCPR